MLMSKSLACAVLLSLKTRALFPIAANGIQLCVGPMPTDTELESLTQASSRITSNVAVTYDTTGLTTMLKDTAWPPQYIMATPQTVTTKNSTLVGTIGWAVFYNATAGAVIIGDVTLTNGTGLITVNTLDVIVGTPVILTGVSIQTGRA